LAGQALGISHIVIFPGGACFFGYTVAACIIPVAHRVAAFGNAPYLTVYRPVDPGYALRYIAYKIAGLVISIITRQLAVYIIRIITRSPFQPAPRFIF